MTLPPPRPDCTNACGECDLGDSCRSYVPPGSEPVEVDHAYLCPVCGVASWYADIVIEDEAGLQSEYRYRECPRCHHMWVPGL